MNTHNIYFYREVDKSCNLTTMKSFDCALKEVCTVIRLNKVCYKPHSSRFFQPKSTDILLISP